jgi:O-antigen ligase
VNRAVPPDSWGTRLRLVLLAVVVLAPLAFGAVHPTSILVLMVASIGAGLFSWARGHAARGRGELVPKLPGRRLILAFQALVLVQLLPLPLALLRVVSPGSFAHYQDRSLVPLQGFYPISVSPGDTLRGLVYLIGFSLLYGAAFREIRDSRWRQKLAVAVVATGVVMTIVALVQAASGATKIYGLWQPVTWYAIYGPYANRNHFAGYMTMACALALGLALGGLKDLRRAFARRRRARWLAFGDAEGSTAIRNAAGAMAVIVGLLASASRGGFLGFVVSIVVLLLAVAARRGAKSVIGITVALAVVVSLGLAWVGIEGVLKGFEARGLKASRLDLWADAARLFPLFPVFGAGFNAFGPAYAPHQTFWTWYWIGQAHNEYLQVLLDTGLVGAAVSVLLLAVVFRGALRAAVRGPLEAGFLAALAALAAHNLVDYNWQIPANAATFAVVAGAAVRAGVNETRRAGAREPRGGALDRSERAS